MHAHAIRLEWRFQFVSGEDMGKGIEFMAGHDREYLLLGLEHTVQWGPAKGPGAITAR